MALSKRMPFVWLLDSAGARIQEAAGSLFAGSGHLFREEVEMSGVIPMVAAMMGPCAAGTAYIPALSDFVPMVSGQGAMALAGPHLTKAVTGEDISMEELGGAKVHCRKSGVGDLEVEDDEACIRVIQDYLSYFPQNFEQKPPVRESEDPVDRMSEKLLEIVPDSSRQPYDMYDVIREIVDDGEWFDIKPKFAKSLITCLARFGGQPVGIVANQPKQLAGILDNDSADKAARFYVMCGKAYEPDLIVAWPGAEISVMGAEGAVEIIGRSAIEASEDPEATRETMLNAVREQIDPYIAAGNAVVDDIIDPRETRPTIVRALQMARTKHVQKPAKRHGVMPV
jgi:acetyl-CoA carboxylase carboxyltransferase component